MADTSNDESLDMLDGGVGIGYDISNQLQVFAGIHFGFSPPSPGVQSITVLKKKPVRPMSLDSVMQVMTIYSLQKLLAFSRNLMI